MLKKLLGIALLSTLFGTSRPAQAIVYECHVQVRFDCVNGERQLNPNANTVFVSNSGLVPWRFVTKARVVRPGLVYIPRERGPVGTTPEFLWGKTSTLENIFAGKEPQMHLPPCGLFARPVYFTIHVPDIRRKWATDIHPELQKTGRCLHNPNPIDGSKTKHFDWMRLVPVTASLSQKLSFPGDYPLLYGTLAECMADTVFGP